MGGSVSSGCTNDDLTDKLLHANYIKSSSVERVFRAVDRAEYFLPESRNNAYKDLAWKSGNLHLSAPCIYSEVMEALELGTGMSFLNLGSGTGYVSTMAGLLLGTNGVNHGIEIHDDVVAYAQKKLEEFKRHSGAIDEYDFCEPKFLQGNCLCLTDEFASTYDRIYCGASCPKEYEPYMKNLIKIGGILVMPLNDQLLQFTRVSETEWKKLSLLPVSFASLISPTGDSQTWIKPFEMEPLSLQILCRASVRSILRKVIIDKNPTIKKRVPIKISTKRSKPDHEFISPLVDSDDSSDDNFANIHIGVNGDRHFNFLRGDPRNYLLGRFCGRRFILDLQRPNEDEENNEDNNNVFHDHDEEMQTEESAPEDDRGASTSQEVHAVIEHHSNSEQSEAVAEAHESLDKEEEGLSNTLNDILEIEGSKKDDVAIQDEAEATTSSVNKSDKSKREKVDSGFGDEIIETQEDTSDDDEDKLEAISSCDDEAEETDRRNKRSTRSSEVKRKLREVHMSDTSSSDNDDKSKDCEIDPNEMRMYKSPLTPYMRESVQKLPLPMILKRYLNYYREC